MLLAAQCVSLSYLTLTARALYGCSDIGACTVQMALASGLGSVHKEASTP